MAATFEEVVEREAFAGRLLAAGSIAVVAADAYRTCPLTNESGDLLTLRQRAILAVDPDALFCSLSCDGDHDGGW